MRGGRRYNQGSFVFFAKGCGVGCLRVITSVDHKGVTCYGLRGRGVESRSLMTSVETRDLSGKVDGSRVNSNTKRVGNLKSRHVDGGMFTTVAILNEKTRSCDP